jgi:hypothetical protein
MCAHSWQHLCGGAQWWSRLHSKQFSSSRYCDASYQTQQKRNSGRGIAPEGRKSSQRWPTGSLSVCVLPIKSPGGSGAYQLHPRELRCP